MLSSLLSFIITAVLALLAIAFYTLMEQKVLAYHQSRKGPNKVGLAGIPQPLADALKLFSKEGASPTLSNTRPFLLGPVVSLILALLLWAILPSMTRSYFIILRIPLFLAISSLSVYATMASGWASNRKYALLGALRGIAQTISYEISMALILIRALIALSSLSFYHRVSNTLTPLALVMSPIFFSWFVTTLAETNRAPFDFAEGERELVSGFNTEYRGGKFAIIFMAEYASILIICVFTSTLFLPSPFLLSSLVSPIFITLSSLLLAFVFISTRAAYPRLRYDLLIYFTWKTLLPISLSIIIVFTPIMMAIYTVGSRCTWFRISPWDPFLLCGPVVELQRWTADSEVSLPRPRKVRYWILLTHDQQMLRPLHRSFALGLFLASASTHIQE